MQQYNQVLIDEITRAIKLRRWGVVHNLCEAYMRDYPNDVYVSLLYINVLLKLGRTKKARALFNIVSLERISHPKSKSMFFFITIKLLLQEEMFSECLNYIYTTKNLLKNPDEIYSVIAYCKKMLNIPIKDHQLNSYTYEQIVNYREQAYFDIARLPQRNYQGEFYPDFNILEYYQTIKELLPDVLKFYKGLFDYDVIFNVGKCGVYNGEETELVVVKGLLHTNEILRINPSDNSNKQKIYDIRK